MANYNNGQAKIPSVEINSINVSEKSRDFLSSNIQ